MSEKELQSAIIQFLRYKKYYCQRINSGMMFKSYINKSGQLSRHAINLSDIGTPDVFACINGKFVAFEIKKDEKEFMRWKKITDKYAKTGYSPVSYTREIEQYRQHKIIERAGGLVFVIFSMSQFEVVFNSITQNCLV